MNIQIKSSNGITLMPLETRLLASRKIFIEGEINTETACEFVKQVLHLNQEDNKKPIDVLINSVGGEINSGMLMYDVIQSSKAPIRMFCMGKAYSMAALLFASGLHGRYLLPNSKLMLHEPLLGYPIGGNTSSIKTISDDLLATRDKLNTLLAKHTGKTREKIEEITKHDHFFTADESVAFGLADEVITFDRLVKEGC